jgi:8-oxo-dGTP pyrophosphatase MutT (NUDIX family)
MELNLEPSAARPRDSATVVLLRDGAKGLEVFLVRRHGMSDVLGGAYVFPGGKVDREDADEELLARMDLPAAAMLDALGEPGLQASEAGALHFAALREAFEETGVLFAATPGADARLAWSLHREGRGFAEVLEALSLDVAASELHPWSRWITPAVGGVMRKRFDTRFFLARVPVGQ